jgi:AcrR family transcriptional regulator
MAGPTTRRRLPVAERRALIVEAAGQAFGERGYDGVTLHEIAAAAGVTKPVLYRHFDSKRALYLALLARHRDDLARFAELIPAAGDPKDRLRAVLEAWLAYVEEHWYAWKMLFRDTGGDAEVAAFRAEVHAEARRVLARMIRDLGEVEIPRREVQPLAELMSMGMASLVLWWIEGAPVSRQAILDAIARTWAGLLAAER